MPGVTTHTDDESVKNASANKKGKSDPEVESNAGSGSEGEDNASEYEIEEVLDAKRGYFPDGRMGYFVKWKGYDHTDNSWVDELDAGNAIDLVNEYWRKHPGKKRNPAPRKSVEKKSPRKPRRSAASEGISDTETASTKKRSRKTPAKKADSDNEMDVDEVAENRVPKKAKQNVSTAQASKAKAREQTPEEEEKTLGNMADYMHMKNWEGLVKTVDTVERDEENNNLMVYFTLTTGEAIMEESTICKERFPRKLLDFYESNLRWRSVEEEKSL